MAENFLTALKENALEINVENGMKTDTVRHADGRTKDSAQALLHADDARLVPLAGGHNFRDLGGYETVDGRRVRWGLLYRSGKLSTLTDADVAQLAPMGIKLVCDLRTPAERTREPTVPGISLAHRGWDYDAGHRQLLSSATAPGATPQHVIEALGATYEVMPWTFATVYGNTFQHLVDGDLPMVFHCTAGKDRTGILAALILTALGVAESDVMADYLLTDRFLDTDALAAPPRRVATGRVNGNDNVSANDSVEKNVGTSSADAGFSFMRDVAPELRAPLLTCNPVYLQRALRAIKARHGSVLGYLDEALGIDAAGLAALRERLLEPLAPKPRQTACD